MDSATIAALGAILVPIVGLILQYLKGKDTNAHGDAFIAMLKGQEDTMSKVAGVLPSLQPFVDGYKATVAEAEKIWDSGGFTAEDIGAIQREAAFWKSQIDTAVAQFRALKDSKVQTPTAPV